MLEGQDVATYALGGTGVAAVIAWGARRVWQQLTAASADGAKNAADKVIYETLKEQVESLTLEMKQLKLEHKQEKLELEHRITDLEAKVMRMSMKMGSIRRNALDCYAELTSRECKSCPPIERALEHIKKILEEE